MPEGFHIQSTIRICASRQMDLAIIDGAKTGYPTIGLFILSLNRGRIVLFDFVEQGQCQRRNYRPSGLVRKNADDFPVELIA